MEQLSDRNQVIECARLLDEHKGKQTIALYIGEVCSFTDYIIITTANSAGHARGLQKQLQEFFHRCHLQPINGQRRREDNAWNLFDLGFAVVHIMSEEARAFYELENLWFSGREVFRAQSAGSSGNSSSG